MQCSPASIISSSLNPSFTFLFNEADYYFNASSSTPVLFPLNTTSNSSSEEVEDCSNTSSSTPGIISSFKAESDSSSEEVEDCSNTSSSTPIVLSSLKVESDSLLKEVEGSSFLIYDRDRHETTNRREEVVRTIKDPRDIPCANKECDKKFTTKGNMGRHCREQHQELYRTIKQHAEDQKPITCDDKTCFRRFSRKDAMKKHFRAQHWELYLTTRQLAEDQ